MDSLIHTSFATIHYLNENREKESILGMENEKVNHEILCNALIDI